jgi:hypothetical protein
LYVGFNTFTNTAMSSSEKKNGSCLGTKKCYKVGSYLKEKLIFTDILTFDIFDMNVCVFRIVWICFISCINSLKNYNRRLWHIAIRLKDFLFPKLIRLFKSWWSRSSGNLYFTKRIWNLIIWYMKCWFYGILLNWQLFLLKMWQVFSLGIAIVITPLILNWHEMIYRAPIKTKISILHKLII